MSQQPVDFTRPTSAEEVALVIGAPLQLFLELTDPSKKIAFYKRHRIPKRRPTSNVTHRDVWECTSDEVATVHKTLARRLQEFIPTRCVYPSHISHGYIPGRSTLTNAEKHAGSALLLRVDIANFFQSITITNVEGLMTKLGMRSGGASAIAALCTLDGRLPLGLHASPILANLACLDLDEKLATLAQTCGASVTRYADDLAFSGDAVPSLDQIVEVLHQEGFDISKSKCRLTKPGQAHYVTGLSISDAVPRLPRPMKRRMRQELYFARKYGLVSHLGKRNDISTQSGVNRMDGTLNYFNAVEPSLAGKLKAQWAVLLKNEKRGPAFSPRSYVAREPVTLLVDETDITTPDGCVLAISIALVVELGQVQAGLQQVMQKHLVDPFSTGDKAMLEKSGLHYVDISEDLRTDVFKKLEFLPVRGYIAYDMLHAAKEYTATYERLVRSLLRHRLMFCDGAEVSLVFEENSKLSPKSLSDLTNEEFDKLTAEDNRRPISRPSFRFGTKRGDPCLAVADFLLAAFRQYATINDPSKLTTKKKQPGELAQKRFDRLRDRIRLIQALPIGQRFSRKRPFRPWPSGSPTQSY
jgi:RNA-directed DNA polymerase